MAESIRSFISIHLPEVIRDQIAGYQSKLRKMGADIRWIPPENLHITLKFLGDITADQIDPVTRSISEAVFSEKPFDLSIGHAGCFPNPVKPRIVWLGIDSETTVLNRIAENLNWQLQALDFPRESRAFKSHLTIGRVKSLKNTDRVVQYTKTELFQSESFTVKEIRLMRSTLQSSGAVYTILKQIQL